MKRPIPEPIRRAVIVLASNIASVAVGVLAALLLIGAYMLGSSATSSNDCAADLADALEVVSAAWWQEVAVEVGEHCSATITPDESVL